MEEQKIYKKCIKSDDLHDYHLIINYNSDIRERV